MKKGILILLMALCVMGAAGCAGAENTEESEVIERSGSAEFFEEKVLPAVVSFGTAALGVVSVLAPVLAKVNRSRKTFDAANAALEALKGQRAEADEEIRRQNAQITALKARLDEAADNAEKLVEMCTVAFLNDPGLVAGGYAEQIRKAVDNEA